MIKYKEEWACFILTAIFSLISVIIFSQPIAKTILRNKKVAVIELSGNGYQRGIQHGRILKTEIAEIFRLWKENIQSSTKQDADSVISRFYNATNFVPAIKKWTPEIYDEIKGISQSSGQSFKDVLCFQLIDEFWVFLDSVENLQNHHCSGLGVAATNSHPAYIAQNTDIEGFRNGYQILLHLASNVKEPEQYILSCPGLIGFNGVNSKSIGVCDNTLLELSASSDGLPVAFVIRGILSRQDRDSALRFVQTIKHASGQNYIIGTIDSVYDFEASASKVVRFLPIPNNYSIVYHTNHAIVNNNFKPWYEEIHKQISVWEFLNVNSLKRFASLRDRLNLPADSISDRIIKEALRSKDDLQNPVCRDYKNGKAGFTFSSVIFNLGKAPSIQLTYASPDQSEYILHTFKEK